MPRLYQHAFPLIVAATLIAYNAIVNEVLADTWHGLSALLVGAALVAGARYDGHSWEELGLTRNALGTGVRYGCVLSLIVIAGVIVLAVTFETQSNFIDDDFADLPAPSAAWEVFVRIPTVTAGFEELAFRSVLLASLAGFLTRGWAVAAQAVLFGLWHILPTLGPGVGSGEVLGAVAFTTAAGVLFGVLQLKTRSLAAPFILHATTNGSTFLAAWFVTNRLS